MSEAYIIDAVRTPRGKRNGSLSLVHAIDLATYPLTSLVKRNKIDPEEISDVIYGCVSERTEQDNDIARGAVLAAKLSESVAGVTLNRFCGSGLTACNFAAQAVASGHEELMIGGGIEHMTRVPMDINFYFGDSMLSQAYPNLVPQGISAEMIAEKWNLSRERLDAIALDSQTRAARAIDEGRFDTQIVPNSLRGRPGRKGVLRRASFR